MCDYSAIDVAKLNAKLCAHWKAEGFKNIKTAYDVYDMQHFGVSIFGNQKLTKEEQDEAYKTYSKTLFEGYYDKDGNESVSVDEFATRELEAMNKTKDANIALRKEQIAFIDSGIDNYFKTDDMQKHLRACEQNENALAFMDTDFDGKISAEEFLNEGVHKKADESRKTVAQYKADKAEYQEMIDDLESEKTQISYERTANLFAKNLDYNQNGQIDVDEYAFFVKKADGIGKERNGQIFAVQEVAMYSSILGANADNEEYNRVINKYLDGETLSAEEQKLFDEAQQAIRKNIKKDAEKENE